MDQVLTLKEIKIKKYWKNTGKVREREFCQSRKVGTTSQ